MFFIRRPKSQVSRPTSQKRRQLVESLEKRVLLAGDVVAHSLHNTDLPADVDQSGHVSARDALIVINRLNQTVSPIAGESVEQAEEAGTMKYDASNDGKITSRDALIVINAINSSSSSSAATSASGEAVTIEVTTTGDSGPGTLRQAILSANAVVERAHIRFAIASTDPGFVDVDSSLVGGDAEPDVFRIQPLSPLPDLNNAAGHAITIDGLTQHDQTDDSNPFGPEIWIDGSQAGSSNGLVVRSSGVSLSDLSIGNFGQNGIVVLGDDSIVTSSHIGIDPTGTTAAPNAGNGINVEGGAGAQIGLPVQGNVISGNTRFGIFSANNDRVRIEGNHVGVNEVGDAVVANGANGVDLSQAEDAVVRSNVISGGGDNGIFAREIFGLLVEGNTIGLNAAGNEVFANANDGILVLDSHDVAIDDNLVGGFGRRGVAIERNGESGTFVQWMTADGGNDHWYWLTPNRDSWTDHQALAEQLGADLVTVDDANENAFITTELVALAQSGFAWHGLNDVTLEGTYEWASGSPIGYTNFRNGEPNGGDVADFGHFFDDGTWGDAQPQDNLHAIIEFESAPDMMAIADFFGETVLQSNVVGLQADGVTSSDPGVVGLQVLTNQRVRVEDNVIANINGPGVAVVGSSEIILTSNRIGTTIEGTIPAGNGNHGLEILDSHNVTVGRLNQSDSNTISNNGGNGVLVFGGSTDVLLQGNEIEANAGAGVFVLDRQTNAVTISSNLISGNAGLGIELDPDGPTANDFQDADSGSNELQNFPVITSVTTDGTSDSISGTFNSTPDADFTLEFFVNNTATASDAEGELLLTTTSVTTDSNGDATFAVTVDGTIPSETFLTATATDSGGNTSEFSEAVESLFRGPGLLLLADGEQLGTSTFSLGATQPGTPRTRTLTIFNDGTESLVLQPVSTPAGFSIVRNLTANQTVAPGESAELELQFEAVSEGTLLGEILISSNVSPITVQLGGSAIEHIQLVRDLNPGLANSQPVRMIEFGDHLYFTADDGIHGNELWKTDGTRQGTTMVADIATGSEGSSISEIFVANDFLVFDVLSETGGSDMWRSDGTAEGTQILRDFGEEGFVFFLSGSNPNAREPRSPEADADIVFFGADDGSGDGIELWMTDGTTDGTTLLKDINPGPSDSFPISFHRVGDVTYFLAFDDDFVSQLWRTDGTTSGTIAIVDDEGNSFGPGTDFFAIRMSSLGDELITQLDDGANGNELWASDGTAAGTRLIADIRPGGESSSPRGLVSLDGQLLFIADNGLTGDELWVTDGSTEGTRFVKDINPGSEDGLFSVVSQAFGGQVYFLADGGIDGRELWISDASSDGTVQTFDLNPGSAGSVTNFRGIGRLGNQLFFNANDGTTGEELWVYAPFGPDELTLSIDVNSITEDGSATGTVTRSGLTDRDLVISIDSADEGELLTSTSVTIAAGSDSATFELSGVNDGIVDGDQFVEVSVAATGFAGASVSLEVIDVGVLEDTFAPVANVNPLPATATSKSFTVSVTAEDSIDPANPTTTPSGVAEIDIFVARDGGAFSLWTTVAASDPQATFDAEEGSSYAFHALARDLAGNVEAIPDSGVRIEAGTFVPDVTAPTTSLISLDDSGDLLAIEVSATDTGGSGLQAIRVTAQVDDLPEVELGTINAATDGDFMTGNFVMPVIADSQDHSYFVRVFAIDNAGNETPVGDNGFGFIVINRDPPASLDILAMDIAGGLSQRSYIRELDLVFNDTQGLDSVASSGLSLVHLGTDGNGPERSVDLSGRIGVSGSQVNIDFGGQGIGGDADRDTGDGIYELRVNLDGDSIVDEVFRFFRLYGDANGDGVVDTTDRNEVNDAYRNNRSDVNFDLDGNGRVDGRDRRDVSRQRGNEITGSL